MAGALLEGLAAVSAARAGRSDSSSGRRCTQAVLSAALAEPAPCLRRSASRQPAGHASIPATVRNDRPHRSPSPILPAAKEATHGPQEVR